MTGEGAGAIGWDDACGSRWTAGKHAGTRTRSAFAHSLTTRYIRIMEASDRPGTADSKSLSINLQAALLSALLVHTSPLPLRTSGWRTRTASERCTSRKKGAMAVHMHVSSATCGLAPAVSSISWAKSAKEHWENDMARPHCCTRFRFSTQRKEMSSSESKSFGTQSGGSGWGRWQRRQRRRRQQQHSNKQATSSSMAGDRRAGVRGVWVVGPVVLNETRDPTRYLCTNFRFGFSFSVLGTS